MGRWNGSQPTTKPSAPLYSQPNVANGISVDRILTGVLADLTNVKTDYGS